jgi:hypothetical protein
LRGKGSEKKCSEKGKKVRKHSFEEIECGRLDGTWFQEEYQGTN